MGPFLYSETKMGMPRVMFSDAHTATGQCVLWCDGHAKSLSLSPIQQIFIRYERKRLYLQLNGLIKDVSGACVLSLSVALLRCFH